MVNTRQAQSIETAPRSRFAEEVAASVKEADEWREAGVEALDVYSELKYVNLVTDPGQA